MITTLAFLSYWLITLLDRANFIWHLWSKAVEPWYSTMLGAVHDSLVHMNSSSILQKL
jgi:hypothetical protein